MGPAGFLSVPIRPLLGAGTNPSKTHSTNSAAAKATCSGPPQLLHHIFRGPDPSGIGNPENQPLQYSPVPRLHPGSPRIGRNDGPVILQQRIQQTRLTHIRRTHDHRIDPFPQGSYPDGFSRIKSSTLDIHSATVPAISSRVVPQCRPRESPKKPPCGPGCPQAFARFPQFPG